MATHTCTVCENEFADAQAYADHTCNVTGFKPKDPQHHGEQFVRQSIKALKRGGSHGNSNEVQERQEMLETGVPHDVSNRIRHATIPGKAVGKQMLNNRFGPPEWAGGHGNKGQGKGKGKAKGQS